MTAHPGRVREIIDVLDLPWAASLRHAQREKRFIALRDYVTDIVREEANRECEERKRCGPGDFTVNA
jgi:hypothetical protein